MMFAVAGAEVALAAEKNRLGYTGIKGAQEATKWARVRRRSGNIGRMTTKGLLK